MGKPVEKKRKKKGRPSLLDLQKRSLRLQKLQEDQRQPRSQNPSPNPYIRFPNSVPIRRNTRRTGDAEEAAEDGEDDEEEGNGKRREKKLKLVLRLHQNNGTTRSEDVQGEGNSDSNSSGPESKNDADDSRKEKKIDAPVSDGSGLEKTERCNSSLKATGDELSVPEPTTPLPDKKLLVFILDRLQKKDTYGVFSEPVDPSELPDYFDVIKHPMDFSTVRKRLSSGYYKYLEMFEKDVFLICTNAMSYNAPDTIYFRQARSIHELAKKDFDNLRQDSEDEDPEPKIVRRGRPPGKSGLKKATGRSPGDRASVDFSDATLANAGENHSTWSNSLLDNSHRMVNGEGSALDRNDDPGSSGRGMFGRMGRKVVVLDENRRHTYNQPQSSKSWYEPPVLAALDGERRQLVPVGLQAEHAYARSLARYAANFGPLAWQIAAKQIEKALPPGTKFGRGWVGEPDTPSQNHSPSLPTTSPSIPPSGPSPLFQPQQHNGLMQFGMITHAGALEMVTKGAAAAAVYAAKDSPPDLNVRFQSPGSPPVSGAGAGDSQQPDLALQL